ncbi:MAG: ABC transporter permease [Gemmatimonadetes bacterium]|nr:ABC transporter permease [Gemmatimonadota bacterium]MXX70821.1 ABC transporter permease [Gemmatimonadota bacterium]MYC90560.1 ABC transporter permease [Gemmatimonadota bacterium]MYG36412.1 ABC transporter permease [Gemmatimonadota bacterium]MYJ18868.1 ABC transporter permease [Gemmatimonadota bacterium]
MTIRGRTFSIAFASGITILAAWVLLALLAPAAAPHDPLATVSGAREAPSAEFWFGTDRLGRDVFSRVIHAARVSLLLGFISVAIGAALGSAVGLVSGYYRGAIDTVLMRVVDAMLAFPGILLALVVIAALGPSITNVMIAVGVSTIPRYARLVRSTVLTVREESYIDAARLIGVPDFRIMLRHVLPNTAVPLLVLSTLEFGHAISVGAGLSFLGLGAQPPTPEWGLMTAAGRDVLGRAWWISTFPGLAIFTVVMATNLLGDSLQEMLDPRLKARRE